MESKWMKLFNEENHSKVVKITNLTLFLSMAGLLAGGVLTTVSLVVLMVWFVFNIVYFGLRKRFIVAGVFAVLMLGYFYMMYRFGA